MLNVFILTLHIILKIEPTYITAIYFNFQSFLITLQQTLKEILHFRIFHNKLYIALFTIQVSGFLNLFSNIIILDIQSFELVILEFFGILCPICPCLLIIKDL